MLVACFLLPAKAQEGKQVRNIIMMIPDGTSTSVLSIARWYKYGICPVDNTCWLAVDKHITGLVKTHSSDAPIGDSAPTGSTYATGYLSKTGYVATYPKSSGKDRDLVPVDPSRAYQPLFTILEASKLMGKSTGLVVTCQFPHATPADFSAHTPHRDRYNIIAKQMVYNNINVVFGGGTKYLSPEKRDDKENLVDVLKNRKYNYVTSYNGFKNTQPTDSLVWGLFADDALPYDIDRNKDEIPSLSEMTEKALQILSKDKDGFFLMVEGSKVDWAAHANDPVGVATEFLAFDKAVEVAIEFARKDGNTAVVICSDHGNSGITIGGAKLNKGYDVLSIGSLRTPLINCKYTAEGLAQRLVSLADINSAPAFFTANTQINLSVGEQDTLKAIIKGGSGPLTKKIAKMYTDNSYIGFVTTGHTGEDVFLANYHPRNYKLGGVVQNSEVNRYMCDIFGIESLDTYTASLYCPDTIALKGYSWQINTDEALKAYTTLVIRKNAKSKKRAEVKAFTDYITIFDGKKEVKTIKLPSVAIYLSEEGEKINRFYLAKTIAEILEKEI